MAGLYVDTSALGRVLLAEPDAPLIRTTMGGYDSWWSSELIVVELTRLAAREDLVEIGQAILASLDLFPLDGGGLARASTVEPLQVRSLDAIHLDAALQLQAAGTIDAVLTFDRQLQAGCAHHQIVIEAPA